METFSPLSPLCGPQLFSKGREDGRRGSRRKGRRLGGRLAACVCACRCMLYSHVVWIRLRVVSPALGSARERALMELKAKGRMQTEGQGGAAGGVKECALASSRIAEDTDVNINSLRPYGPYAVNY